MFYAKEKALLERRRDEQGEAWSTNLKSDLSSLITWGAKKRKHVEEARTILAMPIMIVKSKTIYDNWSPSWAEK